MEKVLLLIFCEENENHEKIACFYSFELYKEFTRRINKKTKHFIDFSLPPTFRVSTFSSPICRQCKIDFDTISLCSAVLMLQA